MTMIVTLCNPLILAVACLASLTATDGATPAAFRPLPLRRRRLLTRPRDTTTARPAAPPSRTGPGPTVAETEAESAALRSEIAALREEARRRLEGLEEKLAASTPEPSPTSSVDARIRETLDKRYPEERASGTFPAKKAKDEDNLLDETKWKISLSVGREPGTWMPADWGSSGQRLNLSFRAECTPAQLFDQDDFLRGGDAPAPAKILHVLDNQLTLGPTVSEGERKYRARDGGWRVLKGDGPLGSDVLRFFIEVEERIARAEGDVYLPRGRVYASCGYFPCPRGVDGDAPTAKEACRSELKGLQERLRGLQQKKDAIANPFSLDGVKLSREIFGLKREAGQVQRELNFALVREPDKSLLRFSPDGDVGVTKEGGLCCKVKKGLVTEYHILGRFSIASMERE